MKIKLLNVEQKSSDDFDKSSLQKLLRKFYWIDQLFGKNPSLPLKDKEADSDKDKIELHVDFVRSAHDDRFEKSGPVEIVIYFGDDSTFTEKSIPIIKFSLDALIEEKIELLDASNVTENNVAVLQRIEAHLNNLSHLLRDALKRHKTYSDKKNNQNIPLW